MAMMVNKKICTGGRERLDQYEARRIALCGSLAERLRGANDVILSTYALGTKSPASV